jgi:hypothetical protein
MPAFFMCDPSATVHRDRAISAEAREEPTDDSRVLTTRVVLKLAAGYGNGFGFLFRHVHGRVWFWLVGKRREIPLVDVEARCPGRLGLNPQPELFD